MFRECAGLGMRYLDLRKTLPQGRLRVLQCDSALLLLSALALSFLFLGLSLPVLKNARGWTPGAAHVSILITITSFGNVNILFAIILHLQCESIMTCQVKLLSIFDVQPHIASQLRSSACQLACHHPPAPELETLHDQLLQTLQVDSDFATLVRRAGHMNFLQHIQHWISA